MADWTTVELVRRALGSSVATDDYLVDCVAAANVWAPRKRREAGYDDDELDPPGADVVMGTTLYAVALWRERASTDGYQSFEDLSTYQPIGGTLGQIRRLLGIGRAAVDTPYTDAYVAPYGVSRRRRRGVYR